MDFHDFQTAVTPQSWPLFAMGQGLDPRWDEELWSFDVAAL